MNWYLFFALLGSIIYVIGFLTYMHHTFYGRVVPHAFTWTVGSILAAINTYNLMSVNGVGIELLPPLTRTLALMIGAIVGWYLIRRVAIGALDYIAIGLALICIYIAMHYGVSEAIIPTIIVDILVLTPTIKKIWINPYSEGLTAWIFTILSQVCLLLSIEHLTIENSLFWWYVLVNNLVIAIYIYLRRQSIEKRIHPKKYIHKKHALVAVKG